MRLYVLHSNAYAHVVPGFAYFFNKFWGDNQHVTVAGYDVRPHDLPRNFGWLSLGKQDELSWSAGMLRLLDRIPGELFILLLEDYWLCRDVDVDRVADLWNYMEANPDIAKVDLTNDRLKLQHYPFEEPSAPSDLIVSHSYADYQMSLQAAIWRVDFMSRFLEPSENAWNAEKKGTKRVIAARDEGTFNGQILGCRYPPVWYVNAIGGEGNMPDQWAKKRFDLWMWNEALAKGLVYE